MSKPHYECAFDPHKTCPVKNTYKLAPESLVEFCKICSAKPTSKSDISGMEEKVVDVMFKLLEMEKLEKKELMEIIKTFEQRAREE